MTIPKLRDRRLLLLLAANFGFVFLSRDSVGLLAPLSASDLPLDSMRLGLQAAYLDMAWAVSGLVTTVYAARFFSNARLLLMMIVLSAGAALLTGLVNSFVMLSVARLLVGAAAGPVLPLSQAILAQATPVATRGFNMGFVQAVGGSLIAAVGGPVLLVGIAQRYGWRIGYAACSIALAITALGLWLDFRPQMRSARRQIGREHGSLGEAPSMSVIAGNRNVRVCAAISLVMVGWLVCGLAFYPTHLMKVLGYTAPAMARLISVFGVGTLIGGLVLPWLSDRHGRRIVMALAAVLGAAAPLAMAAHFNPTIIAVAFLLNGMAGGIFPLFMSIIPSDSLSARDVAAGIGLVQCAGELVGGIVAPLAAGFVGSYWGTSAMMWLIAGGAVTAGLLALRLEESSPGAIQT
jgi:MFS family permease